MCINEMHGETFKLFKLGNIQVFLFLFGWYWHSSRPSSYDII
jgi:hypothetical protein